MSGYYSQLPSKLSGVEGWLSLHEGMLLFQLARMAPNSKSIVEIGSWKGRSTIALGFGLLASGKKSTIFAVDPHEGIIEEKKKIQGATYKEFLTNIKNAGIETLVHPIKKTSKDAARQWKGRIDLLFIDGLHDETNTSYDYHAWQEFLSHNGTVAFHDAFCGIEGVWKAIQKGPFTRADVVNIGTAGSILYFVLGKPTIFTFFRVEMKKALIRIAQFLHNRIPLPVETFLIHRIIRIVLLTSYTTTVYTYKDLL